MAASATVPQVGPLTHHTVQCAARCVAQLLPTPAVSDPADPLLPLQAEPQTLSAAAGLGCVVGPSRRCVPTTLPRRSPTSGASRWTSSPPRSTRWRPTALAGRWPRSSRCPPGPPSLSCFPACSPHHHISMYTVQWVLQRPLIRGTVQLTSLLSTPLPIARPQDTEDTQRALQPAGPDREKKIEITTAFGAVCPSRAGL